MPISRALVDAVVDPTSWSIDEIERATAACDYDRAAVLAFARARAGEDAPAETIARMLPGVRDITLAASLCAIASGDRGNAWLACVRDRRFPEKVEATTVSVVALYAAWRAGADLHPIAVEARRLVRMACGWRGYALLYTIADASVDPSLTEAAKPVRIMAENKPGAEFIARIDRILASSAAEVIEELPPQIAAQPVARFTVRLAPRAGRNELCPCGSSKKFKRCCADKQAHVAPSPVAGLSWDEYVTKGAEHMSIDDVNALPMRELARVDLARLGDLPLVAAIRRFKRERLLDRATHGTALLATRDTEVNVDGVRDEILSEALDANDVTRAAEQLDAMRDPAAAGLHKLEIDLRLRRDGALEALATAADEAVRNDNAPSATELAHTLLRAVPALGLLVARGCLRPGRATVNDSLLGGIEETRDALLLMPGDPAWDVHAQLKEDHDSDEHDEEQERAAAEATALRGSLRVASSRVEDLERELARKQADLDSARTSLQPVAVLAAPAPRDAFERDRVHDLENRVEELEGLVRERNSERADLRRQLAAATSAASRARETLPLSLATAAERDDGACEPIDVIDRGPVIPQLSRRAEDALGAVPKHVASEALRTFGSVCAGDASAWRKVKQAKDMPRQVLMARIGIHHRLLFRIEGSALNMLDVVTRENLMTTLKRMRGARA